jgi:uncharacterized protein (TIGR02246 family)
MTLAPVLYALGGFATARWISDSAQSLPNEEIIALGELWLQTVCGHDPAAVTALYAPDAVLVGTVAQTVKQGQREIKKYFNTFLTKENLCGEFQTHVLQRYRGWAIDSGLYVFQWEEDGVRTTLPARFSFVYRKTPHGWKIANHHSSALP